MSNRQTKRIPDAQSTGSNLFRWGTFLLAPALVLMVLVLGSRSTKPASTNSLPQIGSPLPAGIVSDRTVAGRQKLIFVSETCPLCRERADSYIRHLKRNDHDVLVVASTDVDPLFAPLAAQHPGLVGRIVSVPAGEFESYTGVRTVPSYVRVDSSLTITEVGMSHIGWFRAIMDPRHWLRSWSRLFDG